ncbi:MFS transporter [Aquibaculum sediminis]|uniref:MFS transporter n=1 Tax=Aquibaculum sediminis TaxID=3231907 RepID=UPI00345476F7
MLLHSLSALWALFLGIAVILLANGLQNALLGVRANMEAFPAWVTGVVMAGYFLGFLLGSIITPRLVQRVGHVRVFGAFASLASVAVLLHALFVHPLPWFTMRLVTGFCFAALYIVAESWLNERSDNHNRGSLLSLYMTISLAGMGAGQFLLTVADPSGFDLFILVSVLISLAVVPMLISASPTPAFETPSKLSLQELYAISPLGAIGAVGTGMSHGALFGMGAVVAREIGLALAEVSLFMGVVFLGGILLQFPIGRLSDRFDRRLVLTVVTFGAALAATGALFSALLGNMLAVFVCMTLVGGTSLPLYALVVSHSNDHLRLDQMVAASSTLYFLVGLGASLGPVLVGLAMSLQGPEAFFLWLILLHSAVGLFALYRMTRSPMVPLEEQGAYVPLAGSVTGAVGTAALVTEALAEDEASETQAETGAEDEANAPDWDGANTEVQGSAAPAPA